VVEERRNKLENEFALKSEKLKNDVAHKGKLLEAEFEESAAELQARFSAREKALEEREARVAAEREEISGFREQAAEAIRRREAELAKAFENRFALFKASAEESARASELELSRKHEEAYRQFSALGGQKDAAQARVEELVRETEELKRLLSEKDAYLRLMDEQEQERTSRLRGTFEEEFALKTQAMRAQLAAGEEAVRKNLEERLRAETASLAGQYRIKEEGLAAQRDIMNAQAAELEGKFMEALSAKESENAENIRKALAALNAQLAAARGAAAKEQAELRLRAEEAAAARSAEFEARLKEKDLQHGQQLRDRENQAFADAAHKLELKSREAQELQQRRISDLESSNHILEQNLASARLARDAGQAQTRKLKEELEFLTIGLDRIEQEKQVLIQTNLSQAKDLRLALEKEFMAKLAQIEKNYLGQLTEALHNGDDKGKNLQDEYFKKLAFIKDECAAKGAEQLKEMETTYLDRENRLRSTLEESYKLKEKALLTRYEQMERNYESALSEKAMQLDDDRSMAESVARLKVELEARNHELNSKISEHDRSLEETRSAQNASYAAARKELEDEHRVKTAQLEKERAKVKSLLEQEQQLVADLQKRESVLQESYAAKEAAMAKEFELSRKRLENEYQARLKSLGDAPPDAHPA
jgi:hypothetical protein